MRKDDSKANAYVRSDGRIFRLDGSWWFTTRDTDNGPYSSEGEAIAQLAEYVQLLRGDIDLSEIDEIDNEPNDGPV